MRFLNFKQFIRESVRIELQVIYLFDNNVSKIEKLLQMYDGCKIGKTSDIENRFDDNYKKEGYTEFHRICNSSNKKVIDELEEQFIEHFGGRITNTQLGGGNKSYTGDYWIYVVTQKKKVL